MDSPGGEDLTAHGTVKWFDARKGFGFIVDDQGRDVFVHFTAIEGTGFRRLMDGEEVQYAMIERSNGLFATRVRRLETAEAERGSTETTSIPAPTDPTTPCS